MAETNTARIPLNLQLSPTKLYFGNCSLLSDVESDRTPINSLNNQLNELKAQLEIVNEDRERLRKESEKLKQERENDMYRFIITHSEVQKHIDNEKVYNLQLEIAKLRKECEEKDKLLNAMRKLLGGNEFSNLLKENLDIKQENTPIKTKIVNKSNTKLPGMKNSFHYNRSVSPYNKII
jgi:DNA repair exonuclease SbcCD ATPase subunit